MGFFSLAPSAHWVPISQSQLGGGPLGPRVVLGLCQQETLPLPLHPSQKPEASWLLTGGPPATTVWKPSTQSPERETSAGMGSTRSLY